MIKHSSPGKFFLLIYTDLDGTLLDQETYSFDPALPAINALKEKSIPLILCTSKTRSEIEKIRAKLNNTHPFISENGGAIFIPLDYFTHRFPFTRKDSNYHIIELGTSYKKLREVLSEMQAILPDQIKGFGDLSSKEVADLCGFSLSQAQLAKKREYDEPFILDDENTEERIKEMAGQAGLKITRGGRFYHLIGNNDKGKAVSRLRDVYRDKFENLKTVAIGDSLNDLPMLRAADFPVLVQKPDGSYDPSVKLDNLILASDTGPSGWNDAVLSLIDRLF